MNNTNIVKKVSDHTFHLTLGERCLRSNKIKLKKSATKSTMTESPTVTGMDQVLNMHLLPIKAEYPTTSEYVSMNEFHQSLNPMSKRNRGRPKVDFLQKPIKSEQDTKVGLKRHGRRRGRPNKSKLYNSGQLICGLCDYKAQDFYELEEHLKTHSDQNMYECPYCSSSFSQKGNLITHIRTHTKEKPYKCLICDFAASQKVNLQVHIRVHTKEKPFKCSACDFSAAQKCNLMAHIARRHSHIEVVKSMDAYDGPPGSQNTQLKYYRCNMCMFSCRLKKEILEHIKLQHPFTMCEYQTIDVLK